MSVYTVVTEVPATEIHVTVAATPKEAEKNVAEHVDTGDVTRNDVNAVATLEGLQMFAEDGKGQTAKMGLGD